MLRWNVLSSDSETVRRHAFFVSVCLIFRYRELYIYIVYIVLYSHFFTPFPLPRSTHNVLASLLSDKLILVPSSPSFLFCFIFFSLLECALIDGVEVTVCVRVAIGSGGNRILSSSFKRTEVCESQRGPQQLYITKFGNHKFKFVGGSISEN